MELDDGRHDLPLLLACSADAAAGAAALALSRTRLRSTETSPQRWSVGKRCPRQNVCAQRRQTTFWNSRLRHPRKLHLCFFRASLWCFFPHSPDRKCASTTSSTSAPFPNGSTRAHAGHATVPALARPTHLWALSARCSRHKTCSQWPHLKGRKSLSRHTAQCSPRAWNSMIFELFEAFPPQIPGPFLRGHVLHLKARDRGAESRPPPTAEITMSTLRSLHNTPPTPN